MRRRKWGRAFSFLLSLVLTVGSLGNISLPARAEETVKTTCERSEYTESCNLNLTEEGSLDWLVFSDNGIYDRKDTESSQINYEPLEGTKGLANAGDCSVNYTWSDGTNTLNRENAQVAAVFGSSNANNNMDQGIGYRLSLEAADYERTLAFVGGAWEASFSITVKANDTVILSDSKSETGAKLTKYTIKVAANERLTVELKLTTTTNYYGNITLGGVTLSKEEVLSSCETNVISDDTSIDLTEEGNLDWIVFSENGLYDRKNVQEEQIVYNTLSGVGKIKNAGDCKTHYTWTDGTNHTKSADTDSKGHIAAVYGLGGVFGNSDDTNSGFTLEVGSKDTERTLTFYAGIWAASYSVEIKAGDQVILSKTDSTEWSAKITEFKVNIAANEAISVKMKVTDTINENGNVTLGAVTLKSAEGAAGSEVITRQKPMLVATSGISGKQTMDLSESEVLDWIYVNQSTSARKKDGNILTLKTLKNSSLSGFSDSRVAYEWNDGDSIESNDGTTEGRVYLSRQYSSGTLPSTAEVGYKISVPAGDTDRVLTFVPGVWQAKLEIQVINNGEVIFTTSYSAGSTAVQKICSVPIEANQPIEVVVKMTEHVNEDGNVTVGGITLKNQSYEDSIKVSVKSLIDEVSLFNLSEYDAVKADTVKTRLIEAREVYGKADATSEELVSAYEALISSYEDCKTTKVSGTYKYDSNSGLTSSFGWEGDINAPIAYIDGSYLLRDRGSLTVNFGVRDISDKITWFNKEGYLPCFVSQYSKDDLDITIENFSNKHEIGGNAFEIAYSRMTVTNNGTTEAELPRVHTALIPLNDAAKERDTILPGETVVRDYAIGADRFGGTYDYPSDEKIALQGSYADNYQAMKDYWNDRLAPLTEIEELPDEQLINAYKAGFIYTLIIRDDITESDGTVVKELHVGENGYDIMFDHDTIGIVSTLLTIGDFTYAKDYLASLPAQLQYDDAKWKYSMPYAIYLEKTGDLDYIKEKFEVIKGNTHKIEDDRDMEAGGIMKKTWAIDSYDYWLIDNWSALTGLTTYKYLCDNLYESTGDSLYLTESNWADSLYDDLLSCVEKKQKDMRDANDYPYLSIDMNKTTENSARGDARDANWASMFLFGRWAWDGYLFGADQEDSDMISLIDDTYTHGFERREEYGESNNNEYVGDTIYNFGGYPHGYYSSAYNAGYGSAALRGEEYRDCGIKAYEFMIENSMSGPFGWWEGVNWPSESSSWDIDHAQGGGGSCQHMWGQSTATKVLFDSLVSEKVGEKVIIGRGVPTEWISDGEVISLKNISVDLGKNFDYKIVTTGNTVTIEFSGDTLSVPYSIELLALKDNIASVTVDGLRSSNYDRETGIVTVNPGSNKVIIKMGTEEKESENISSGAVKTENNSVTQSNKATVNGITERVTEISKIALAKSIKNKTLVNRVVSTVTEPDAEEDELENEEVIEESNVVISEQPENIVSDEDGTPLATSDGNLSETGNESIEAEVVNAGAWAMAAALAGVLMALGFFIYRKKHL